jgi:hypothetical protein
MQVMSSWQAAVIRTFSEQKKVLQQGLDFGIEGDVKAHQNNSNSTKSTSAIRQRLNLIRQRKFSKS